MMKRGLIALDKIAVEKEIDATWIVE